MRISSKIEKKDIQVQSLIKLGLLYWSEGQIEKSFNLHKEALLLAENMNLEEKKQECLNYIEICRFYKMGKEYRSKGKHQKSIESFDKAIALAKRIKSKEHEVKCLRQLSITFWELNNLNKFFSLNKEALEIAKELNHKKEVGRCLSNIGAYYQKLDHYSQALKYYQESLEIARDTKNNEDKSICLTNISNIYCYIGNYDKALGYMIEALKIDLHLKKYAYISMDLNNVGETFLRKGLFSGKKEEFDRALKYFGDCLELARKIKDKKTEIQALNNIGFVQIKLKNNQEALRYLESGLKKASDIQDLELMSMLLNNIGAAYFGQRMFQASIESYKKAIELANGIKARQILWEAYFGLGQCYEMKSQFYLALIYYKKAVAIIDQIRRLIFLDADKAGFARDKLTVYESLLNLLYDLHQNDPYGGFDKEIFYQVERAKARAFLESLSETKIDIRESLTPEVKEREREISQQISLILFNLRKPNISEGRKKELLRNLEEKEDEHLGLISRIRSEVPQFADLFFQNPISLENLQSQWLDEKIAFVEYFLGEKKSFLFFITKNDFVLSPLPPEQEIKKSVRAYLKILSTPAKGRFKGIQASKRLLRELLFPLDRVVPESIENLVIIPDGALYYLPFETLTQGNEFLINKYKISYGPSSTVLTILFENKYKIKRPKSILAFGNPVYTLKESSKKVKFKPDTDVLRDMYLSQGFDFSPLPYSEKEVLEISNYFPKEKKDIYLRNDAKEEVFKSTCLKDYQIIHFACHGFLDEEFPFRSALVLTLDDDPIEDGFLQVREIYTLRLNADLIVLSACQTGKGRLERGEGLLGLPRIFFYTGANSVLTSLWKINDKSTSEFMTYFYQYFSQGKDKAQALRLTKLKMMHSPSAHPFYWAAFVLNGDYSSTLNIR